MVKMCSTPRPGHVEGHTAETLEAERVERGEIVERGRSESSCSDVSVGSVASLQPRIQSTDMERLREDEEGQARDRWKNIISFCKLTGDAFVDDSFPPRGKKRSMQRKFLPQKD